MTNRALRRKPNRGMVLAAVILLSGCGPQVETPTAPSAARPSTGEGVPSGAASPAASSGAARTQPQAVEVSPAAGGAAASTPEKEEPRLEMPEIKLSDAHAATCLVKQGQPLPPLNLADLDGERRPWSELLGRRLTVVFFWSSDNPYSLPVLADMGPDVLEAFGPRGVNVVGINVRDATETAGRLAREARAGFPVLLDADGDYFAGVSSGPVPRLYLVDASGKVLWFDIEYSRDTRRLLHQAIEYSLAQK